MNDKLVIRLLEASLDASTELDWDLYDSVGRSVASDTSSLASLHQVVANHSADYTVVVIVPAESLLLASTTIPSRQLRQIKQALPFMVEELIADDIESVHIAIPDQLSSTSQKVDVAVVNHQLLIHWLDQLHSCELSASSMVVDSLSLPYQENSIAVLLDDDRVLVRSGDYAGMVIQAEDFKWVFAGVLQQHEHADDVLLRPNIVLMSSAIEEPESLAEITSYIQTQCSEYELKTVVYEESVTDILANTAAHQAIAPLNLLQGGYAVKAINNSAVPNPSLVASVAALSVLVYLVFTLGSAWYFENKAVELDADAVSLYQKIFPNERRIVSPKKQMQNHLQRVTVSGGSNFLQLLSETAGQISADNNAALTVEQLRYESGRGDLQFQVQSASLDQLDQLKQSLAQAGLDVDINSATEQGDRIMGRLVIRSL
ncbi:type II secretion system protein GspL [Oceanicoccus sagamiensis]|uniref:Type II secretion system protein L n=1 Tax=Oceanicoccus sagamiensis TaxID=716816 RepID=A0A1X9NJE8_9GAMM|nr:type II secretion system protein GspL [Oceanicoccus sagamiensis]ARN75599.1 type II secretion system protein GspL [Oceanicoccus sagamiensis]